MLGTACFRLCSHRSNFCSPTVVQLYGYHSVPHPFQVTCRHVATASLCRSLSWPRLHAQTNEGDGSVQALGLSQKLCCHGSHCVEKGSEVSCATIWHGLVPSHQQSISISPSKNGPSFYTHIQSINNQSSVANSEGTAAHPFPDVLLSGRKRNVYGLRFPDVSSLGNGNFAMATSLQDGSWNVAWDVRPARWLHGRHSAWLSFGVRASLPAVSGLSVPLPLGPLSQVEGANKDSLESNKGDLQRKHLFTDYTITGTKTQRRLPMKRVFPLCREAVLCCLVPCSKRWQHKATHTLHGHTLKLPWKASLQGGRAVLDERFKSCAVEWRHVLLLVSLQE